jgi:hypothetical protein
MTIDVGPVRPVGSLSPGPDARWTAARGAHSADVVALSRSSISPGWNGCHRNSSRVSTLDAGWRPTRTPEEAEILGREAGHRQVQMAADHCGEVAGPAGGQIGTGFKKGRSAPEDAHP